MSLIVTASGMFRTLTKGIRSKIGDRQDTDIYFDPQFAEVLEVWAVDTAWREIQVLLGQRRGKVLDLACGTGRTHDFLKQFPELEYYGCDISQPLIDRAVARGIPTERLRVADATKLDYSDGEFDFVFSIGSLEHFTVEGLTSTISEIRRVCRGLTVHHVPVSKSGFNEGWITPYQSYWNNSERWWIAQFAKSFGRDVWSMSSHWEDRKSSGRWFICAPPESPCGNSSG